MGIRGITSQVHVSAFDSDTNNPVTDLIVELDGNNIGVTCKHFSYTPQLGQKLSSGIVKGSIGYHDKQFSITLVDPPKVTAAQLTLTVGPTQLSLNTLYLDTATWEIKPNWSNDPTIKLKGQTVQTAISNPPVNSDKRINVTLTTTWHLEGYVNGAVFPPSIRTVQSSGIIGWEGNNLTGTWWATFIPVLDPDTYETIDIQIIVTYTGAS